jgi:hypothetical protein
LGGDPVTLVVTLAQVLPVLHSIRHVLGSITIASLFCALVGDLPRRYMSHVNLFDILGGQKNEGHRT